MGAVVDARAQLPSPHTHTSPMGPLLQPHASPIDVWRMDSGAGCRGLRLGRRTVAEGKERLEVVNDGADFVDGGKLEEVKDLQERVRLAA